MPKPHSNENRDDYMSRCVPMVLDEGTAKNRDQAVAICSSMFEKKMLKEKYTSVYGNCTGPFGFPMLEAEARALDEFLTVHTKDASLGYRKVIKNDAYECFIDKEHSEVSIVTDQSVDKTKEVILAEGVNFEIFAKNPVVTLSHDYKIPPIGKSLWQKRLGSVWKAKTHYIERPENHPKDQEWAPDTIWHLVKNGYMPAKSVGFLPIKFHEATSEDKDKFNKAELIFDEIKVFEYAVVTVGCNDNCIVDEISKGLKIPKDIEYLFNLPSESKIPEIPKGITGVTLEEYISGRKNALVASLQNIDFGQIADDVFAKMTGKV